VQSAAALSAISIQNLQQMDQTLATGPLPQKTQIEIEPGSVKSIVARAVGRLWRSITGDPVYADDPRSMLSHAQTADSSLRAQQPVEIGPTFRMSKSREFRMMIGDPSAADDADLDSSSYLDEFFATQRNDIL